MLCVPFLVFRFFTYGTYAVLNTCLDTGRRPYTSLNSFNDLAAVNTCQTTAFHLHTAGATGSIPVPRTSPISDLAPFVRTRHQPPGLLRVACCRSWSAEPFCRAGELQPGWSKHHPRLATPSQSASAAPIQDKGRSAKARSVAARRLIPFAPLEVTASVHGSSYPIRTQSHRHAPCRRCPDGTF